MGGATHRAGGTIYVLLAATLWGTTGTAAALAPGVGPLAVGAAAMGIGGLLQGLIAVRPMAAHIRELRRQRVMILLGAAAIAIYPLAFYSSMRLAGVTVGTVVSIGLAPVIAAVIERIADRRPLSRRWLVSTGISLLGICALTVAHATDVAGPGDLGDTAPVSGWRPLLGLGLAVLAAGTYALYSWVAATLMLRGLPARAAMGALFGLGGLLLLPVVIIAGAPILATPGNLAAVAYLAVVPMFLGYVLFGRGLAAVSASTATTLSLWEPVVAAFLAVLVLREQLPALGWIGVALVLIGLAVLTVRRPTTPAEPPSASSDSTRSASIQK
ncbi:MAG: EamA family transporter [Microlunatus sp.]